jgi:hypothetical protein
VNGTRHVALSAIAISVILVACGSDEPLADQSQTSTGAATNPTVELPSATSYPGLIVRPHVPIVFTGSGSQTIEIPDDPTVYLLTGAVDATHDGTGPFTVSVIDAAGEPVETPIDVVGPYEGRRGWLLDTDTGPGAGTVEVVADGNWSLSLTNLVRTDQFRTLDVVPGASVEGEGDDVVWVFSSDVPHSVDVQCTDCRSGIMITGRSGAMDTAAGRAAPEVTVLVDDATDGTFETSFVLPPGYLALQIETYTPDAPGNWVLTVGEPGPPTPATTP